MGGSPPTDFSESLRDQVRDAHDRKEALQLRGGSTKQFLAQELNGLPLDLRPHSGIVHYDPSELVLTARCGTPLRDIEASLEERGQMLAYEPPYFGDQATFGGMVATGLSGPRRPWSGAVRDYVLGCRLIDGQGRVMRFGGEVIKNVAGYDLSRLLTGSFGCLALLLEVSVKVLPRPRHRCTLRLTIDVHESLERLAGWRRTPMPITGACHDGHSLFIRLEGGVASVGAAARSAGGEPVDDRFWTELREHRLPFFSGSDSLWRLSLPPGTGPLDVSGQYLIDWAGAQHWLRTNASGGAIRDAAVRAGGSAIGYRTKEPNRFHPLSHPLFDLHRRLKERFDPEGIFNPGRLYMGL